MKKFLSLLFVIIMIVTLAAPFTQTASAATTCESGWVGTVSTSTTELNKIKVLMQQQTSSYKMSRFNQILSEYSLSQYFCSNKDSGCNWHCAHTSGQCKSKSDITDLEKNTTISLGGNQCFGYAQYCGYKFFGTVQKSGQRTVQDKDIASEAAFKNYLNKYSDLTGAHFRVITSTGGKHSLVYLAKDDTHIYFIDANSGTSTCTHARKITCGDWQTKCKIHLRKFTYSSFLSTYQLDSLYYQESPTSSLVYTQSVLNDNVITGTNAILYGRIEKPYSHTVNKIGIRIRKEGTSYTTAWTKIETPSSSYRGKTLVQPYYNLNTELGITLTPGTKYYYQFYGKVNNVEYWSAESSFVATASSPSSTPSASASASISHGYTGCTDTITADNAVVYGTLNKSSGTTVEKFGIRIKKTGGSYSTDWTYTHEPKSTYSTSTSVKFWYDIKEEMGITLTHLTSYTYQLYAKVNGVEYWSSEKSFTTTGSHTYGSWVTTKAATCTAAGTKTRKCSGCSQTETATIAATGHSYGAWTTSKAATCLNIGTQKRTCSACSALETKNIATLGHNYSSEWTVDKQAGCITEGSKSHHCTRCSAKDSITAISATGHTFGEWQTIVAPTTTANGAAKRVCANCTATENKTIPALAADGHTHNFGEWKVVKEANCKSVGTQERFCGICGVKETQEVSIKAHEFGEWSVKTAATEQAEGTEERKCNDCEHTETRGISKLPETIPEDSSQPSDINSSTPTDNNTTPKDNTLIYVIVVSLAVVLSTGIVMGTLLKIKKK